jgi:hypothetical protein
MNLDRICLQRLRCWIDRDRLPDPIQARVFQLELGQIGFRVGNIDRFTATTRAEFELLIAALSELRGADVNYVPLFVRFPDDLPNDGEYFVRRIVGFFGLSPVVFGDLSRFGADPVTQMQRSDLWLKAIEAQSKRLHDKYVEWIDLSIIDRQEAERKLTKWCTNLLYGTTPVKEQLWADIFIVLDELKVQPDLDLITIKETLARLAADRWQKWGIIAVKTPTDLLRMFAFLCEQDVSLARTLNLKGLKFSKPQRRSIVTFLNNCPALPEDLLRYRGLWISLSKWLHPGDFVDRFPRVAKAFDDLRNNRIKSFESQIINAPSDRRIEKLLERPSLLLRKLTWLLKDTATPIITDALSSLIDRLDDLPLPLLASVYFAVKYDGSRVVINKKGTPYPIEPRQIKIDVEPVLEVLDRLIITKLSGTKDWDTVWIDPALDLLILPLQSRQQSDGLLNIARGSWLPIEDIDVIRLFVYWQETSERTDLDLSVLQLDREFNYISQVSWNNYGDSKDIAHSGDIQSAPMGSAEFIDLNIDKIEADYILPSVLRFTGETFIALKACHIGWMKRQSVGSDTQTFDPQTVTEKISPHLPNQIWIPFMLDVKARQIIYIDLYTNGHNTIEDNPELPKIAAALSQFYAAKPTFAALARWYVMANHAKIVDKENAIISIGTTDDCTINVLKLVGDGVMALSSPDLKESIDN